MNNTIYDNIWHNILLITDDFDMSRVMSVVRESCPESYSEVYVKELALNVLDALLDCGMVRIVEVDDEKQKVVYRTELAPEKTESEEKLEGLEPSKQ